MAGDNYQQTGSNRDYNQNQEVIRLVDQRSTKEKVISGVILVVVFLVVFVGYFQLMSNLKKPLFSNSGVGSDCLDGSCYQDNDVANFLTASTQDTDKDGLTDYEEINIYGTSPYIADSDSDGIPDGEEVAMGRDPNCPGEGPCLANLPTDGSSAVPQFQLEPEVTPITLDPQELRQIFVQSGMPQNQVDQMSDEEIVSLYRQVLAENNLAGVSDQPSVNAGNIDMSNLDVNSVDDLRNLSGAEIRQMLIEAGAPAQLLNQVSDEELKNMFISNLESRLSQQ